MAYFLTAHAMFVFELCCLAMFGSYSQGYIQDNYIGCYYDANNQPALQRRPLPNNALLTIELCIEQCRILNATYAGLQNSEACLCGDNFGVSLPDTSCNSLCPGNPSYCGGSYGRLALYSLYAVCNFGKYGYMCDQVCHCKRQAPCDRMTGRCPNGCEEKWFGTACNNTYLLQKYIGCFRDNETRAISPSPFYSGEMTVEYCIDRCASLNNSIAGLQAGGFGFCGESYARYGQIDDSNCNTKCAANASQFCGGSWANSVYSVCPAGYYGPKCHNQCHCYNNSRCVYMTGECNSTCKAGWASTSCNIRDCSMVSGGCFQNETCNSINLMFATVTRCRCLQGFQINSSWGICEDINECSMATCDDQSTTCINTLGSYECHRKPGYEPYNRTTNSPPDEGNEYSKPTLTSTIYNQQDSPPDEGNEYSKPTLTSTIYNQQVVPVGVAIGAAVGSALGSAFLVIIVVIGIFLWRRRRQQQRNSEEFNERRHRAQPNENLVSTFAYDTLKKRENPDESTYTELTSTEVASQSQTIGKGSETEVNNKSSPNDLVRESNKVYEELQ